MAYLQASSLPLSSFSCSSCARTHAAVSLLRLPQRGVSVQKLPSRPQNLVKELGLIGSDAFAKTLHLLENKPNNMEEEKQKKRSDSIQRSRLCVTLEEVIDRIEMHKNIGEQRNNWNTLMLSSVNLITLTAAVMAGIASMNGGDSILAMKLSSTLLLASATGLAAVMSKIQPSQLVEEQRNATRLFTQLRSKIESVLRDSDEVREDEVKDTIERVLCIDRAYPLPLLGTMLEKFPEEFKPTTWWPKNSRTTPKTHHANRVNKIANGWSPELEMEMREVAEVVKARDAEEFEKLRNVVLRLNRILAISGPVLTGVSAVSSAFVGHGSSWAGVVTAACASLAAVVNALEHSGQVGMVFEMYRNTAGFFSLLEQMIESVIGENDAEKRENGQVFETKVALKLGRSLSELRDLSRKSGFSRLDGSPVDEFASKLF